MAKITSRIPNLNNLKQCLRFLEWLKNNEGMQGQVANELSRRLKVYYSKNVDAKYIESSLSSFLREVSHFYEKLCNIPENGNYIANEPTVVLYTLLACIPKVLSVVYFLQYNVDKRFAEVGGGGWEGEPVSAPSSAVSKIDAYFTDGVFKRNAVIPGGFKSGELKEGDKGGYVDGSVMAHDLPKLLSHLHENFFSDVFVTSALTTAGSQPSNTANALALLKIFCEIVEKNQEGKIEKALEGDISNSGNCIPWERLREQCSKLKESLEQIFNAGVLSNTGHSPEDGDLYTEKFAKKMAKWLRDNLDKVGGSLKEIKPHQKTSPVDYFTKHFFPYGFIFNDHNIGTESNGSEDLKRKWEGLIGTISGYGAGLDKLVEILKGEKCTRDHVDQVDRGDDDDDDDDDDVDVVLEEDSNLLDGNLDDGASGVTPNQKNGQSVPIPDSSQVLHGSNVPPEDGKGPQGHAGAPDDAGKISQDSGPPAQQPVPPLAAAHTSSTSTPSPVPSSPGGLGAGGGVGAPGPKGDQGQLGPAGSVDSASSQVPDAQVIQSPQPTLQSSAMSTPTPPASPAGSPTLTAQTGALGGGGVGGGLISDQMAVSPKSAMLAQTASASDPPSVASGVLSTGSDSDIPDIESDVVMSTWKHGRDDYHASEYTLIDNYVDSLRYPKGMYPPKYPISGPQTSGKARTQSDRISYQDTLQDMSDSSDSFDPHDANESFEHFNFTIAPYDGFAGDSYIPSCQNPWYVEPSSITTTSSTPSPPPDYDHLPSPKTVREMLYWLVGFVELGYIGFIQKHVEYIFTELNNDASPPPDATAIAGDLATFTASHVTATLKEACLYAATIICRIKHYDNYKAYGNFNFKTVYSMFHYSSDPACLLCKLRDYAYACHYQLQFLKSQCSRNESRGGWKNCEYGSEAKMPSPLQAFLTDAHNSKFKTHLFDPCNICLKSRVRIGFKKEDLPEIHRTGGTLSSILSPSCGGEYPLLTLSSYLNCLTRRTPRTTGELVSYFHNFGKSLYDASLKTLSKLGSALTKSHPDCPDWDHLDGTGLQAVRGIRGYETLNSKHDRRNDHSNTLSTLIGCCSDSANCPQYCSPITYQAYSLYSPIFAHTYLSWAVYMPDRLWESLERLRYDFKTHTCSEPKSFHQCSAAMPLLYTHGFMPPEGKLQWPLTCSDIIVKLRTVVDGKPIATLMTCMDDFLYRVRMPFIYTLIALWSVAALLLSYTLLYRLDVLYLCSHFIRSKASHLIDVKALLTNSRKMLSLYDADYFDDDPTDLVDQLK